MAVDVCRRILTGEGKGDIGARNEIIRTLKLRRVCDHATASRANGHS
jgi:hypothetical protein